MHMQPLCMFSSCQGHICTCTRVYTRTSVCETHHTYRVMGAVRQEGLLFSAECHRACVVIMLRVHNTVSSQGRSVVPPGEGHSRCQSVWVTRCQHLLHLLQAHNLMWLSVLLQSCPALWLCPVQYRFTNDHNAVVSLGLLVVCHWGWVWFMAAATGVLRAWVIVFCCCDHTYLLVGKPLNVSNPTLCTRPLAM